MADVKDLKIDGTKYNIKIPSENVKLMTGYSKGSSTNAITPSDSLNSAMGKLECRADADQDNILYAINTGAKNCIVYNNESAVAYGLTITRMQDRIQINGTATASFSLYITGSDLIDEKHDPRNYSVFSKLPDSVILTGAPDSAEQNRIIVALYNDQTWIYSFSSLYDMPQDLSNYNYNRWYAYIPIVENKTYSGIWKPMLRNASISDDTFIPGALPNYELTRLQSEDRAALAEVVGYCVKNLLDISQATFSDRSKITFNSDGSVTGNITSDTRTWGWENSEFKFTLQAGTYVLYCKATTGSNTNWGIAIRNSTNSVSAGVSHYTGKDFVEFTLSSETELGFMGKIFDRTLYIMICTKSQFDISQAYAPFALPNYDLTPALAEEIDAGSKNLIQNVMTSGTYSDGKVVINVNSDGSFTVKTNSTLTSDCIIPICSRPSSVVNGQGYMLSGCPAGGAVQTGYSIYWEGSGAAGAECADIGNGALTYPKSAFLRILLVIKSGTSIPNAITFKPMLCTIADWKISQKFVPYRPDYDTIIKRLPNPIKGGTWVTSYTVPMSGYGRLHRITIIGGSPSYIGEWIIMANVISEVAHHNNVTYTVNANTNIVFNMNVTCLVYDEIIDFY